MYKDLLKKIKEYDQITIFRHIRPDGDCTFSQLALYYFLKDNFKDKKIKLAGFEKFDIISKIDKVSDKFIENSLGIALDIAKKDRVDDSRLFNSAYIIKIDHHPADDNYGNINIVNPKASATCEILADILLSKEFNKFIISNKVYKYLYCGLLTDTLNFKTSNTTAHSLKIGSILIEKGNLKPSDLYEYLFNESLDLFNKLTKIRNYLQIKEHFGYIKLNSKQLKQIDINPIEAKYNIDIIGSIKELNVWAFAVEVNGKYDCSIRSKRKYIINKIASKYNGGGHANAAAVKQLNQSQIDELFKELYDISSNM